MVNLIGSLSHSSSYLRESDLEGAILQHTQAVDYYLSTAPKWQCPAPPRPTPAVELQALFRQDVAQNYWSTFAQHRSPSASRMTSLLSPSATNANPPMLGLATSIKRRPRAPAEKVDRLDDFLQQDQENHEELAYSATAAAVRAAAASALATAAEAAASPCSSSSPAASVRAMAMARASSATAQLLVAATGAKPAPAAHQEPSSEQPAPPAAVPAATAAPQQPLLDAPAEQEAAAAKGRAATAATAAAGQAVLHSSSTSEEELEQFTSVASKLEDPWAGPSYRPSSSAAAPPLHKLHRSGKTLHLQQDSSRAGPVLLWGFLFCVALLGALTYRGNDHPLLTKGQEHPLLLLGLLTCLVGVVGLPFRSLVACCFKNVLHFEDAELEQRYMVWFRAKQVFLDTAVHVVLLLVGSCLWLRQRSLASGQPPAPAAAMQPVAALYGLGFLLLMVPTAMLLFMRSSRYIQQRGKLLLISRACITAALLYVQYSAPTGMDGTLSLPAVTVAQLVTTVCMQVRLSSFLPLQAAHLAVVLATIRCSNPLVFTIQLAAFGMCLPALLLFYLELYNRRSFAQSLQPSVLQQAQFAGGSGVPGHRRGGKGQEQPGGLVHRAQATLMGMLG